MAKKMTISEQYAEVKAFLVENGASEDMVNFIVERSEMHAKKNGNRKPNKEQVANQGIKTEIINAMESDKSYTVTEIQKLIGIEQFNKVNALVKQLKDEGLVVRSEVKGRAYFTKA